MPKILPHSVYVLTDETSPHEGTEAKFASKKDLPQTGTYYVIASDGIFVNNEKSGNILRSVYVLIDEDTPVRKGIEAKFVSKKELPQTGTYYVATSDGIFLNKNMDFIQSATKTQKVAGLAEGASLNLKRIQKILGLATLTSEARLNLEKIPAIILGKAHYFFSKIWAKHRSEAGLLILYDKETKEYDLWCPEQTVSGGSVRYKLSDAAIGIDKRWRIVGTIHSHCNFSAYHSGIDVADEADMDGVHITLGHVDTKFPSIECSIVVNANRWLCNSPNEIANDITLAKNSSFSIKRDRNFSINLSENDLKELEKSDCDSWFSKVKKESFDSWWRK